MVKNTKHRRSERGAGQGCEAAIVERAANPECAAGTSAALGGQEQAVEAEALDLIVARPDLARAVVRQFGVEPDHIARSRGFGLTDAQYTLLDFICAFRTAHGVTPSFEEMRKGIGLASKSGVHRLVASLEERGHVLRVPRRARSIVLREVAS